MSLTVEISDSAGVIDAADSFTTTPSRTEDDTLELIADVVASGSAADDHETSRPSSQPLAHARSDEEMAIALLEALQQTYAELALQREAASAASNVALVVPSVEQAAHTLAGTAPSAHGEQPPTTSPTLEAPATTIDELVPPTNAAPSVASAADDAQALNEPATTIAAIDAAAATTLTPTIEEAEPKREDAGGPVRVISAPTASERLGTFCC